MKTEFSLKNLLERDTDFGLPQTSRQVNVCINNAFRLKKPTKYPNNTFAPYVQATLKTIFSEWGRGRRRIVDEKFLNHFQPLFSLPPTQNRNRTKTSAILFLRFLAKWPRTIKYMQPPFWNDSNVKVGRGKGLFAFCN